MTRKQHNLHVLRRAKEQVQCPSAQVALCQPSGSDQGKNSINQDNRPCRLVLPEHRHRPFGVTTVIVVPRTDPARAAFPVPLAMYALAPKMCLSRPPQHSKEQAEGAALGPGP